MASPPMARLKWCPSRPRRGRSAAEIRGPHPPVPPQTRAARPSRPPESIPVAVDVKVIITLYISLRILHAKYAGRRQNEFNIHG
jgi:hypothetical protein